MIGNLAVMLAAVGAFGTGTGWPDVIVAAIMGLNGFQFLACRLLILGFV